METRKSKSVSNNFVTGSRCSSSTESYPVVILQRMERVRRDAAKIRIVGEKDMLFDAVEELWLRESEEKFHSRELESRDDVLWSRWVTNLSDWWIGIWRGGNFFRNSRSESESEWENWDTHSVVRNKVAVKWELVEHECRNFKKCMLFCWWEMGCLVNVLQQQVNYRFNR